MNLDTLLVYLWLLFLLGGLIIENKRSNLYVTLRDNMYYSDMGKFKPDDFVDTSDSLLKPELPLNAKDFFKIKYKALRMGIQKTVSDQEIDLKWSLLPDNEK